MLLELAFGPLLTPGEREVVLQRSGMVDLRRQSVSVDIEAGHCLFSAIPTPTDVAEVVRELQRLAWFVVDGPPHGFRAQHWCQTRRSSGGRLVCLCFLLLSPKIASCVI